MTRHEYLLAELRCASLRARLWQVDIDAVGMALKAGWISPEQAVEALADCNCLQLIEPKEPAA
jgi:predicted RNA-binding protein associated with RNAse of E/G family